MVYNIIVARNRVRKVRLVNMFNDLDIIDCIKYNRDDYNKLRLSASYEHTLKVI